MILIYCIISYICMLLMCSFMMGNTNDDSLLVLLFMLSPLFFPIISIMVLFGIIFFLFLTVLKLTSKLFGN
jgi:hypothetical protein